MHQPSRLPTKYSLVGRLAAIVLSLFTLSLSLLAESSSAPVSDLAAATVSGYVSNDATGAYLQGAEVTIEGTELRTVTQEDGSFVLRRVPSGEQTLRVAYSGLGSWQQVVRVGTVEPVSLDIALKDTVHRLSAFIVVGQREGNASSINRQRSADNIMNVIATDAYGNVADGNIGNFIQRLPGVSVVTSEGEVIGIGLRGIPPDQSAVTVDGALMAAAVAGAHAAVLGDRAPPIDRIPPDFIKEIEIVKAATPDQPANGLGGSVNLKTKSAFDFNQSVTTYRIGMNQNLYRDNMPFKPTGSFSYMNAFGPDRRLGVSLSASYHRAIGTRDRYTGQRNTAEGYNTQLALLNDVYDRIRWGYTAKVEYKLSPKTLLGAHVTYSSYTSDFVRYGFGVAPGAGSSARIADYGVVSRASIEAGTRPRSTSNQIAGVAPGYTRTDTELLHANVTNSSSVAFRTGEGYKYGVNLDTEIAGFDVDVRASYNPESYDREFIGISNTLTGVGVAIDSTRLDRPVLRQLYGPSIFADTDFSNYTAETFRGPDHTEEEIAAAQIDVERTFDTRLPFTLKMGAMWTEQHRFTWTGWRPKWTFVGADGVAGRNPVTGVNDDNLASYREPGLGYGWFRGYYPQLRHIEYYRVEDLFWNNSSWFAPVGTSVSRRNPPTELTETVSTGYVMGKTQWGDLQIVGGVRAEHTNVDAIGLMTDPLDPTRGTFNTERDYDSIFPSIHFRYAFRPNLLLRASNSTSMARPSISQLTPNTTVNHENETVSQGNAALKPQYSRNYDLSLEYYIEPAGVLSIAAYHKDITDYILNASSTIGSGVDNMFNGAFAGYLLNTTTNAGGAKVTGGEVNYAQSFPFLPAPWDGLSLSANYTRLKSEGTYSGGASVLRNYVPWTANLAVSYTWKRLEVRVAARSQSSYLLTFNANPLLRQYSDKDKTIDINLQYTIRPWLKVYADVVNVMNYTPDVYNGDDRSRVIISEYYGAKLNVGVSGRF